MSGRIINFGSLNIDHVYQVDRVSRPGETILSKDYARFAGGKGANQSLAIARAGARVVQVGKIGQEGRWMIETMRRDGVDTSHIAVSDDPGGHAIIQVDPAGENTIVIFGGTNRQISREQIDRALQSSQADDLVLLQNEINGIREIMEKASALSLPVYFNAAPKHEEIDDYPLQLVDTFFINELEGEALTGRSEPLAIVHGMLSRYTAANVVLTLGSRGLLYGNREGIVERNAERVVEAVDTTGAGDTFIGYFMAGLSRGRDLHETLMHAGIAAALCVTRAGAADSIPFAAELDGF